MEIKVTITTNIIIQDGETNINEIFHAIGNWSKQIGPDACKGVIENYQEQMVELLCNGKGNSIWAKHKHKKEKNGQLCVGGSFRRAGVRKKEREFRTELGKFSVKMQLVKCETCGKRFAVLLPLLNIPARGKAMVKIKHIISETVTDLSYRKGSHRLEGLAQIIIPKSTLHRWMINQNWERLSNDMHTEPIWKSFQGIMADGTGYKRQGAETTKGDLRIVMGMSKNPRKLVPLGVWADKSWEQIDNELSEKRPENIKAPSLVIDGEKGQQALGNLTEGIQRCHWHASSQLGYFLWKDGLKKDDREVFLRELSGLIKIELPKDDYKEVLPDTKKEIEEQLKSSRKSIEDMINSFYRRGYFGASTYLKNASDHLFTVVEKWLQLGYMPPKVISLLERVMREMGRRIKKIGASWKQKGLLAVAHVLLTRLYSPEQWEQYWAKLMDIQNRCFVKSYHISFAVVV